MKKKVSLDPKEIKNLFPGGLGDEITTFYSELSSKYVHGEYAELQSTKNKIWTIQLPFYYDKYFDEWISNWEKTFEFAHKLVDYDWELINFS